MFRLYDRPQFQTGVFPTCSRRRPQNKQNTRKNATLSRISHISRFSRLSILATCLNPQHVAPSCRGQPPLGEDSGRRSAKVKSAVSRGAIKSVGRRHPVSFAKAGASSTHPIRWREIRALLNRARRGVRPACWRFSGLRLMLPDTFNRTLSPGFQPQRATFR